MSSETSPRVIYTTNERVFLWSLAVVSFFGINSVFVFGLVFDQEALIGAFNNPIAFAFILEAFLLMGTFSYFLTKWKLSKLHWGWFIFLSISGSLGFALPVVLLWPGSEK